MTRPAILTVDTGGPDDVYPGLLVTWLHTPRDGYGFAMPIDATVVSHARRPRTWVRVKVTTRSGRTVQRVVDVSTLRWRTT